MTEIAPIPSQGLDDDVLRVVAAFCSLKTELRKGLLDALKYEDLEK